MSSAFLVFDLIRRNASPERSVTPEVSSIQNLMTVKKRSGLSSEKRVNRVPVGKASPKATGRINQFFDQTPVAINTSLRVLTSFNLVRGGGRRGSAAREKLVKKSLVEQDREISREELHQLVWSKPIGTPNWKILPTNPKIP